MSAIDRIRAYHATQAVLALLSFVTGELEVVHAWLGYSVGGIIVLRLLWTLSGESQFGLTRFHPSFEGLSARNFLSHPAISKTLMLGIFLSLIGATVTGVALDRGKTVGTTAAAEVIAPAYADGDKKRDLKSVLKGEHENEGDEEDGLLEEAHEALSNLMMVFVAMHIAYIILFRWPLARFMLFISKGGSSRTK